MEKKCGETEMDAVYRLLHDVFPERTYTEEPILTNKSRRGRKDDSSLPPILQEARGLERQEPGAWRSRERIFLKQAKLLENYEDTCTEYQADFVYCPTYQSLNNRQLRGYFGWRERLRKGVTIHAPQAYYDLYTYELINQIGVENPMDGYQKLISFRDRYACDSHESAYREHINNLVRDYVLYYDLPDTLLRNQSDEEFDRALGVLTEIDNQPDEAVANALRVLAGTWLNRSRFYKANREDMDAVLVGTIRGVSAHYAKGYVRNMVEQLYGRLDYCYFTLFLGSVFLGKTIRKSRTITVSATQSYRCENGSWYFAQYIPQDRDNPNLTNIIRTVDCRMRQQCNDKHPMKQVLHTKWLVKLIDAQIQALIKRKQDTERLSQANKRKKLCLDYGKLAEIRRDAAVTQEKLIVDEEESLTADQLLVRPPEVAVQKDNIEEPVGLPLTEQEARFLRCLLLGKSTIWLREDGKFPSVMADGINEKLFDTFGDTVLTVEDCPIVVADYAEDLKEMMQL